MRSDTCTESKNMGELDVSLAQEKQNSFLEDDLALSSSAHESSQVGSSAVTSMPPNLSITYPTRSPSGDSLPVLACKEPLQEQPVIYLNENAMDCTYDESSDQSKSETTVTKVEEENPQSPDIFESDADDEADSTTSTFQNVLSSQQPVSLPSPKKLSTAEMIIRADKWLLRRANKFLSGVPPPPSHTISQKDCGDFIIEIYKNRQQFWADPFELDKNFMPVNNETNALLQKLNQEKFEIMKTNTSKTTHQTKAGLRNLSTAFDECEQASNSKDSSVVLDTVLSDTTSSFTLSDTLFNSSLLSSSSSVLLNEDSKICVNDGKPPPTLFQSIKVEEITEVPWPDAYKHKCHGIYYNRNQAIENYENLRMKLTDTYVGAETQSTCNIWFAKQMPGSARKRNLLARRNNFQSPGKRLSYLARRRKTFTCGNLQNLGLPKEKLVLNISKGSRKGKSPRGKSPRNKSPRKKTPRSSAKKRLLLRRLQLDGPSPRKTKIETSKRALFQSPPNERPGPSRPVGTATVTNNNTQKFKRALFPTPKKNEANASLQSQESRKRKSDEDLENSRTKWPKSLSFDCASNVESSSASSQTLVRHSTSSFISKEGSTSQEKGELSDTHRKKLIWAVARALGEKGIDMKHPMFKKYTAILGRYVRKNMPDLENKNIPRKPGSTSDRMLKFARRHVILVINPQNT